MSRTGRSRPTWRSWSRRWSWSSRAGAPAEKARRRDDRRRESTPREIPMSSTEAIVDEPGDTPNGAPAPARSRPASWAWAAIACVLLGASGVVRTVQERRHNDEASYVEACPFPLESISPTLGAWKWKQNAALKLDPQTMRITGGSDHILRTYAD